MMSMVAGRYEIEHELARGGMGVVYRALDRTTGRSIALKRSLTKNEGPYKNRLQREYQTLVTLRHPHIIQVFDFGIDEVGPYYTMELLDGSDLRAVSPLPWKDVCRILRDVTSSLALLHSRRLLHCDVGAGNVRLTGEGRAKLIDFGALASFGKNSSIAGTPPTTPPEAIEWLELDQGVDLYAVGATAYYALTGRHAYPAPKLMLLPAVWQQGIPDRPSAHVPEIPRELDDLVMSLLELDRSARPRSAAEVIDRLDAIAGLPPDQDERVVRSYLLGTGLVGRDEERGTVRGQLSRALSGEGGAVLIAGGPGLGKSALLDELLRDAKVAGARVITVDAGAQQGALGAWAALVGEAVQATGSLASSSAAEQVFVELAEKSPLVVAVDNIHKADHESLRAYARLSQSLRRRPILFAATADFEHAVDKPGLAALRARGPHVELAPFDSKATQAFVESLFGQVPAGPRLSAFLQDHAVGNPRTYAEVVAHLIERGFIRYVEGAWVLPHELPAEDPGVWAILEAAFERRRARWSESLTRLAICLSPHRSPFDIAICRALTLDEPTLLGADLQELVTELVREGVLVAMGRGTYAFAQSRIREVLYGMLSTGQRKQLHARLARALELRDAGAQRGFEVGIHYFLAGEVELARRHINQNIHVSLVDPDKLVASVGDLWTLLEQQRKAGATDEAVALNEGVLVVSGYYVDPTVYDRFGDRSLAQLYENTGFARAARLQRWLGTYLALLVGVCSALAKRVLRKPDLFSATFLDTLLAFMGACSSMGAGACLRLERKVHPRLIGWLSIAKGFGRHNGLRLVHDLLCAGSLLIKGRFTEAQAGLEDQLVRLPKVPFFHEEARHHYAAGLHFFMGRNLLLRGGNGAVVCAGRIETLGAKQDLVMAQFLRRTHFLYRGDLEAVKREQRRLDELSARHGARWAPDLLAVLEFLPYHLTGDVLGLKQTLRRMEGLLSIAPGLSLHRAVVEAMYEGHRGRPDVALAIYARVDAELAPFSSPIWAPARAHQAECLNALGRSSEALSLCEDALSNLREEDRINVFAYQQLEREAALALSALGQHEQASARLNELLAHCSEEDTPLLHGLLHYDRARVAAAALDGVGFEQHAEAARITFAKTGNPVLIARGRRLLEMERAVGLQLTALSARVDSREVDLDLTTQVEEGNPVEVVLSRISHACRPRCAELRRIERGMVSSWAHVGEAPPQLEAQVTSVTLSLTERLDDDALEDMRSQTLAELPPGTNILPLVATRDGERQLVGVLTVVDCARPEALTGTWLAELAIELAEVDEAAR